jgi:hypothetical protein
MRPNITAPGFAMITRNRSEVMKRSTRNIFQEYDADHHDTPILTSRDLPPTLEDKKK